MALQKIVSRFSKIFINQQRCTSNRAIEGEPQGPSVKTSSIPGPNSIKIINDLKKIQQADSIQFIVDYDKSLGNYIVDADNNVLLDLFSQIASMPLGYNHPQVLKHLADPRNIRIVANRPALGVLPGKDWPEKLRSVLLKVAPPGFSMVTTMMCGSCSNENAFKMLFINYMEKRRSTKGFTKEEMESCMINLPPGSPKLSILSFSGAFHGRTIGCLTTTHSKAIHKLDIPAFNWPIADFPQYKYPLNENMRENKAQDEKCLAHVEDLILKYEKIAPVAGIVTEPIQAEGGDNEGSPEFFRGLQKIAKKYGAGLLIDEVQTGGGATGKMWCHEYFDFESPPDIVTFGKKMQLGGYYHKKEFAVELPFRIINTWLGDPGKIVILEAIIDVIQNENLLQVVQASGKVLRKGLDELSSKYPYLINSVRGRGTFLAFSAADAKIRDEIVGKLKLNGIQSGGCGELSVRLRPALIFKPHHAEIFLDKLENVLSQFK